MSHGLSFVSETGFLKAPTLKNTKKHQKILVGSKIGNDEIYWR